MKPASLCFLLPAARAFGQIVYRPPVPQPQPTWTPRPPLGVIQPDPEDPGTATLPGSSVDPTVISSSSSFSSSSSTSASSSTSSSTSLSSYDGPSSSNSTDICTESFSSSRTFWTPPSYQTLEPPTTLPEPYISSTATTPTTTSTPCDEETSLPPYSYYSSSSSSSTSSPSLVEPSYGYESPLPSYHESSTETTTTTTSSTSISTSTPSSTSPQGYLGYQTLSSTSSSPTTSLSVDTLPAYTPYWPLPSSSASSSSASSSSSSSSSSSISQSLPGYVWPSVSSLLPSSTLSPSHSFHFTNSSTTSLSRTTTTTSSSTSTTSTTTTTTTTSSSTSTTTMAPSAQLGNSTPTSLGPNLSPSSPPASARVTMSNSSFSSSTTQAVASASPSSSSLSRRTAGATTEPAIATVSFAFSSTLQLQSQSRAQEQTHPHLSVSTESGRVIRPSVTNSSPTATTLQGDASNIVPSPAFSSSSWSSPSRPLPSTADHTRRVTSQPSTSSAGRTSSILLLLPRGSISPGLIIPTSFVTVILSSASLAPFSLFSSPDSPTMALSSSSAAWATGLAASSGLSSVVSASFSNATTMTVPSVSSTWAIHNAGSEESTVATASTFTATVIGYTTARVGPPIGFTRSHTSSTQQPTSTLTSSSSVTATETTSPWTDATDMETSIIKLLRSRDTTPFRVSVCYPELQISSSSAATEFGLNAASASLDVQLQCTSSYKISTCAAFINGKAAAGVTCTANSVHVPSIFASGDEIAHVSVAVVDALQNAISNSWSFVGGSAPLSVIVKNPDGSAAAGASVAVQSVDRPDSKAVVVADVSGVATFSNIPSHSVGFTASLGTAYGVGTAAGGKQTNMTVTLQDPLADKPLPVVKSGSTGCDGWLGKVKMHPAQQFSEHETKANTSISLVWTDGQVTPQVATRAFALNETSERTAYIKYRFQSSEAAAGNWGAEFGDMLYLSIVGNDGSSQVQLHGITDLGPAYFDQYGFGPWSSLQLPLSANATGVSFTAAVANVLDGSFQSEIVVHDTGVCSATASCDDCPGLARCQSVCQAPVRDTCSFYWSCARQSLQCTRSQTTLFTAAMLCSGFQDVKQTLSIAAQNYLADAELCVQQAMVPGLMNQRSCQDTSNLALMALPQCYAQKNLCALQPSDYATIFGLLGDQYHRAAFRQAITEASLSCSAQIVKAFGPASNVSSELIPVRDFFARIVFDQTPLPSVNKTVEYIQTVNTNVSPFASSSPRPLLDFFRWPTCNNYLTRQVVGDVPPTLMDYMSPKINSSALQLSFADTQTVSLSDLFCAAAAVNTNGINSTAADLATWAGLLFSAYADWRETTFSSSFSSSAVSFLRSWNSAHAEAIRAAIDGSLVGALMNSGATVSGVDAFRKVFSGTAFSDRVASFKKTRFGGSNAAVQDRCGDLLDGAADDEAGLMWALRTVSLSLGRGNVTVGNTAVISGFCGDFAETLGQL